MSFFSFGLVSWHTPAGKCMRAPQNCTLLPSGNRNYHTGQCPVFPRRRQFSLPSVAHTRQSVLMQVKGTVGRGSTSTRCRRTPKRQATKRGKSVAQRKSTIQRSTSRCGATRASIEMHRGLLTGSRFCHKKWRVTPVSLSTQVLVPLRMIT